MLMTELESQEVWKAQLQRLTYTQGVYDKYDKELD